VKSTLVDAGPLIALFDSSDAHHTSTRSFLENFHSRLFTTWPVLTEATDMLSFSTISQTNLFLWTKRNGVVLFPLAREHLDRLMILFKKYSDVPVDLADASLLIAAEDLGVTDILTIDSDYSVYRTSSGKALRNLLKK
jgi:predicted nucleic acid-binding protein